MKKTLAFHVILREAEGSGIINIQIEYETGSFGFAQNDNCVLSPLPIYLANKIPL